MSSTIFNIGILIMAISAFFVVIGQYYIRHYLDRDEDRIQYIEKCFVFGCLILFIIGCFSHIFGFVINDIIDIKLDKLSTELTTRPLVSGIISIKKAFYFAILCMIISFIFSIFFFNNLNSYLITISFLILAYIFAIIYNIISKKYPGMDIFVAGAVFLLVLFGASTIGIPTFLSWIVAFIGGLQVLFMNLINGTIKDIDHDAKGMAKTLAIRLGARINGVKIVLPVSFKVIGYIIESGRIFMIFVKTIRNNVNEKNYSVS